MLCPHCKTYVTATEPVCPVCGAPVDHTRKDEGVQAIRQGRRARETMPKPESAGGAEGGHRRRTDKGASHVYNAIGTRQTTSEIPLYGDTGESPGYERYLSHPERSADPSQRRRMHADRGLHEVSNHMINWARVAVIAVAAVLLLAVGTFIFLRQTDSGQVIMARLGYDATAAAMWQVGEERLDTGDIDRAIELFEKARALEAESEEGTNVDGLLLLGSAYEAAGDIDSAEALYTDLYQNVVPTRAEPYRNLIRLLENSGRYPEAADLMQVAYEKTGVASFQTSRSELLPSAPSVDVVAGYYTVVKHLTLTCDEGCDIYYTFDENAELPADGILYTEPILLEEGVYTLRAVAVKGDLVSDQLTGTWKVIMPSPQKPGCNLAPATYTRKQTVRLRVGEENQGEDITIYYTIDGSIPDEDSPIWDGTPIQLPTGRVYLRAVAVNEYGKSSNMLEVFYKIDCKPYPLTVLSYSDFTGDLTPATTTRLDFELQYGEGLSTEEYTIDGQDQGEKVTYSWGYAIFGRKSNAAWILYGICYTTNQFPSPRNTGIGQNESAITGQFRDAGQVASPSGNRGLYTDDNNTGKVLAQEDGTKIVRYRCDSPDGHIWQLSYHLNKSGTCDSIEWLWIR